MDPGKDTACQYNIPPISNMILSRYQVSVFNRYMGRLLI